MTTEFPPTLGLVLAGGLARRMGGGDKALLNIGRQAILDRVLARLKPHCTSVDSQRERRSDALCALRSAGRRRRHPRFRRTACRNPRRTRLGRCQQPRSNGWRACRAIARSCHAISYRDCMRRASLPAPRSPAPSPASGVIRSPALWPVSLRADLRRALTDEGLHKIEMWTGRHGVGARGILRSAGRSVLQCQPPRGPGRGRAYRSAIPGRLNRLLGAGQVPTLALAKSIAGQSGLGEDQMKEFIIAVVAAVAVGVISVYALDMYQKPASVAYSSPSGVRL